LNSTGVNRKKAVEWQAALIYIALKNELHVFMLPPVTLIICILYDIAVQFTDTILSSSFAITLVSIPVVFRI